jgi:PIN domain nuclease of toxin-antitoxin system
VRLLLDTQVFVWASQKPSRLGAHRDLIADPDNERLVSAIVAWELAIKTAIGRLSLPEPVATYMPARLDALVATPVAIEHEHALAVSTLPMHHRDPFDRLLIAQAQILDVPIITADRALAQYDVEVLLTEG